MIRYEDVRFKILRNRSDYGFLVPKSGSAPSLRCRSDAEIKMSITGDFFPYAVDSRGQRQEIDWLADEIQPLLYLNGVEHKLNIFAAASVTNSETETGSYVSIEAYDRCWRVRDTKMESILHIPSGVNYLYPVKQLLAACGISDVVEIATSATIPEPREDWAVGTSYLTIINDLLREINYNMLWFDSAGYAMLQPIAKTTAENVQHILSNRKTNPRDRRSIGIISMKKDIKSVMDIYNAANVFVCSCSNPDKDGIMIATAENNNPQSPISIPRRGRRIMDYEDVRNIASQQELQKYAEQKRDKSMFTNEVIECDTLLAPGFGVSDVVGLHLGDVDNPDRMDYLCIEKSWDMQLKVGGIMKHQLERVVYNIDG